MDWDEGPQDPIADIKAFIKHVKARAVEPLQPDTHAIVAAWAYDYVNEHPTHEGCGGEWIAFGYHFWCTKCRRPLTSDMVE